MTLDEQLQYIATLQRSHDEQIGKLVEQTSQLAEQASRSEKRLDVLTERTIQAMEAINRLARIAGAHEDRIGNLENPPS
jgi:hypothetical protein